MKTSEGNGDVQVSHSTPALAAVDAGFAKIPEPEIIIPENNFVATETMNNTQSGATGTREKAVDAGAFNASQSSSDSAMISNSHQNDLEMAAASGNASDGGTAKLPGEFFTESDMSSQDSGLQNFDRSNAIFAGEFSSQQIG
jgi:hypothetical protein